MTINFSLLDFLVSDLVLGFSKDVILPRGVFQLEYFLVNQTISRMNWL